MPPVSFTVSEVRAAATCPRVLYFEAERARRHGLKARRVTRIWKSGDGAATACGALFHNAVEKFNRLAADAPEVRTVLAGGPDNQAILRGLLEFINGRCVNLDALATKPVPQRLGFINALHVYVKELADIVADALARGKPADEVLGQMFGDRRRRVDVTFPVGPAGEPVHVTGILDYVFFDWRAGGHRIIDYKLTPAHEPTGDLFQVGLYALMHNLQHRTEADVGVLYLHPDRLMAEMSWSRVTETRQKVFDLLASMAEWVRYDEASRTGLKPPGEPSACAHCKWDRHGQCLNRLGPKHEGRRLRHWSDAAAAGAAPEPRVVVRPADGRAAGAPDVVVVVAAATSPRPRQAPPPTVSDAEDPHTATPPLGPDALRIGMLEKGGAAVGLPLSALPTHVAVVGAAGSGKTWMAKVLAEEAVRLGVPVLAIDPQGDLVQFLRPSPSVDGLSAGDAALRRDFLARVEPRVWTPGTSHARRLGLEPIRLPGRAEWARVDEEGREGLLAGASAHLVGLAAIGGEVDSQQTFVLQVLRALVDRADAGVDLDAITAAIDAPDAVGLDAPERFIKKSEREKLVRRLNGLRYGPSSALYAGGRKLDLDAMRRPDAAGRTPLNVVYLNALGDDERKQAFVASLAAEVYRWMVTSLDAGAGKPNLLLYLDEARDFIPAGTSRPPAKGPLIRLFAQGRKYGVACLLCTQSPRSVDYNVFGNCSTKLVGRLERAQDVERVAEWFGKEGPAPPWLAGRKGAGSGSFVARWPGMPAAYDGRSFRSRPLFSLHEGAWSPDRLARETAGAANPPGSTPG